MLNAKQELALREIGNIAYNMAKLPAGFDVKEQFERIRKIADTALGLECESKSLSNDLTQNSNIPHHSKGQRA